MSSYIDIQTVSKTFKDAHILTDITFSLTKGEILSVVGASGSGKSTLLRLLSGLESVTSGKLMIEGKDISSTRPKDRQIGMVFQQPLLFPHMNVLENVMYGLAMKEKRKKENRKRAEEYIERVGLGDVMHHYPSELSGGQQQRVSLIRSLILKPKLLLLDEPFSALDLMRRKELRQWMRKMLKEEGTTVLFVTHDRDEAYEMGDRVGVLNEGRFLQIGTPEDIYYKPGSPFVASFMSDGLTLPEGRFIHSSHIEVCGHDQAFRKWKGTVLQKLFVAGTDMYEVWVEELGQKLNLPLDRHTDSETIWLGADERHIQTFQHKE
ncbi:ABC transporter ATP-binding protein [Bacillus sp. KH172YL63]|uniref:ABC transporter ATP-binding protein n=1 Tax=Bacillus sp. KH172YL63 TaxID=2709784 RepID=UPI0013E4FE0A|nr:ABC transporter ATP-binding protein [Bacillus sp. KH172YL63]BCB02077.1 hypothetical protein KH172YL63_02100 [Bacillus sp. KH172YL63]